MKTATLTILTLFLSTVLFGQNSKDSLIAFIGEIIEVKFSPEEKREEPVDTIIKGNDTDYVRHISISMDSRYIAKYKILQLIQGNYQRDTIEFIAFDHYGKPSFSKYKTVLLFVSISDGKLYHEKYQYFALYLAKNGKWASPYPTSDYSHPYKEKITVRPEKIEFTSEVSFPLDKLTKEQIEIWYPAPYYEIKNDKAIAIYGNYIDDLFKLKKQTILKARGYY
jgi:hypothetical protein